MIFDPMPMYLAQMIVHYEDTEEIHSCEMCQSMTPGYLIEHGEDETRIIFFHIVQEKNSE